MTEQPQHHDQHDHRPSSFLDADQRAYQDAAATARQAAIDDEENRQSSYPQRRRMWRRALARRLRVG